jgi:hypothetical protein
LRHAGLLFLLRCLRFGLFYFLTLATLGLLPLRRRKGKEGREGGRGSEKVAESITDSLANQKDSCRVEEILGHQGTYIAETKGQKPILLCGVPAASRRKWTPCASSSPESPLCKREEEEREGGREGEWVGEERDEHHSFCCLVWTQDKDTSNLDHACTYRLEE